MNKKRILSLFLASVLALGAFASFAFAADTVTVTFLENDGCEPYTAELEKGLTLHELPLPDCDNDSVFVGWFKDEACREMFFIDEPINGDISLYARWSSPLPFEDIDESTEFFDGIAFAFYNDIMRGVTETAFAPETTLTRGMFVTMLYRSEGEPEFENSFKFEDVKDNFYYAEPIAWANLNGIVNGVSPTEFAPDAEVTREQMATILYRYAESKELPVDELCSETNTLSYDDIFEVSEYARPAMHVCLALGALTDNRAEGKVFPQAAATRAEAAQAFMKIKTVSPFAKLAYEYTTESLAGEYFDSTSGRATLTAEAKDEKLFITVRWANSAFETVEWTMTATLDGNTLSYSDCTEKTVTYAEDGSVLSETAAYENGSGFFTLSGYDLLWDGAADENCTECLFVFPEGE